MGTTLDTIRNRIAQKEEEENAQNHSLPSRHTNGNADRGNETESNNRTSTLDTIRQRVEAKRSNGRNSPNRGSSSTSTSASRNNGQTAANSTNRGSSTSTTTASSNNQTADNDSDRMMNLFEWSKAHAEENDSNDTLNLNIFPELWGYTKYVFGNMFGGDDEEGQATTQATQTNTQATQTNTQTTSQPQSVVPDEMREAAKERVSADVEGKFEERLGNWAYNTYDAGRYWEDGYQFGDVSNSAIDGVMGFLTGEDGQIRADVLEREAINYNDRVTQAATAFNAKRESGKTISEEMEESINHINSLDQTLRSLQPGSSEYTQAYNQYVAAIEAYGALYQEFNGLYTPLVDSIADYDAFIELYGGQTQVNTESDPYHLELAALESQIDNASGEEKERLEAERDALLEQGGYLEQNFWGWERNKYGAERFLASLLGFGESLTDFAGTTLFGLAEGVTSGFGLKPNSVSNWLGDRYDEFVNNSVTNRYKQSIKERYRPQDGQEEWEDTVETIVRVALPVMLGYGLANLATGASATSTLASTGTLASPSTAAVANQYTQALFGASAAGSATSEAAAAGANHFESLTYGWCVGAMEMTVEKLSGNVAGMADGTKIGNAVKKVYSDPRLHAVLNNPVVNAAVGAVGESGEEALSAIITPYIQRAIYDEYALNATAEEIGEQALLGGIASLCVTAGVEVPVYVSEGISARNTPATDVLAPELIDAIVNTGLESPAGTDSYNAATQLKAKLDAGKTLTAREVMDLHDKNVRQVNSEEASGDSVATTTEDTPVEVAPTAETPSEDPLLEVAREAVGAEPSSVDSAGAVSEVSAEADSTPIRRENAVEAARNAERSVTKNSEYGEYGARALNDVVEKTGVDVDTARTMFNTAYKLGRLNTPRESLTFDNEVQRTAYEAGRKDAVLAGDNSLENGGMQVYNGNQRNAGTEGVTNEVHLRNGSQWAGSPNPGGQVPGVEESAGRNQSRKAQGRPADSAAASLAYGKRVSTASFGIAGGSRQNTIKTIVGKDTPAMANARQAAKARGLRVVFFAGNNLDIMQTFTMENGTKQKVDISARAYISGDRVFVRVDHPKYTADQIMRHEIGHDMIAKGEVDPKTVRERIDKKFGKEKAQQLADMYAEAYAGTNMTAEEVWEEVICDSLGDMNIFSETRSEGDALELLTATKESSTDAKAATSRAPPAGDGKMSMDVFPPYNISKSDANEHATRWAHQADVKDGDQKIVPYHGDWYIIEADSNADLRYRIISKMPNEKYQNYRRVKRNGNRTGVSRSSNRLGELDRDGDWAGGRGRSSASAPIGQQGENLEVQPVGAESAERRNVASDLGGNLPGSRAGIEGNEAGSVSVRDGVSGATKTYLEKHDAAKRLQQLNKKMRERGLSAKEKNERADIKERYHFSMETSVEQSDSLVAYHNLSVDDLWSSFDRGGFAAPSVAVKKAGEGHVEFGDVTAVFRRDAIDPAVDKRNKLFGRDAWTPQKNPLKKNAVFDQKKTADVVKNIKDNLGLAAQELFDVTDKQFQVAITRADGNIFEAYANNMGVQAAYAVENGIIQGVPVNEDGSVDWHELVSRVESELDTDAGWREYRKWLNGISDNVITSFDKATNEDIMRSMAKQPDTAKPFRLSLDGKLVVPAVQYDSVDDFKKNIDRLSETAEAETEAVAGEFLRFAEQVAKTASVSKQVVVDAINGNFTNRYDTDEIARAFRKAGIAFTTKRAQQLQGLYRKAVELPTQYFEAKPMRATSFNETAAIVIPDTAPASLLAKLKGVGVNVTTYKNGNKADRIAKTNEAAQEAKFSRELDVEVETAINQSMTMQQAKDMVQRAFVLGEIKEWFEGEYKNGDEWLKGEGVDAVALVIDNEWSLQEKYLNKIRGLMDEEFTTEDILNAYAAGTLTGKQVQDAKPKRLNVSNGIDAQDSKFFAPHVIKDATAAYELASQKVTNKNRDAVYKARADVVMFAHTKGAAEALGLTQAELNKKLSAWARYTARARETSERFNAGVAEWNKWTGIENSNILTRATVSNEDLERLVGEITGDNDGFQRKYIMRTMLALDTHIDYSGLSFEFVGMPDSKRTSVNGLYSDSERKIRVKRNAPNTVAHEMGHFLDYQWARDIGVSGALTDGFGRNGLSDPDVKQWAENFDKFKDALTDVADMSNSYTLDAKEVFARFVDKFVRWVNFTANGEQQVGFHIDRNDRFTAQHYIEFVRLLQEKSVLDGKKQGDVKFSRELDTVEQWRKDYAKLEEVNQALREQFKVTKLAKVDSKSLDSYTKRLLKDWSSEADIAETRNELDALYTYIANGENGASPVWEEAYKRAYGVAEGIIEQAIALDDDMYQTYKELRNRLRTSPISINPGYGNDLMGYEGLQDFRKRNFGRIKMSNDGTPVDVRYAELAASYPELFDETEHTHPADQLTHIAEVLDDLQPVEVNPYSHEMREATTWLANDIMERFFGLPQAKPTFADKAERKLTEQAIKDAKKLERVREQKDERIRNLIEQGRERTKKVRAAEMDKRAKAVKQVKEHYAEKEAKASEGRKKKILQAQIVRHVEQMSKKLLKATDKNHVPQELRGAVAELLSCINLESNYTYDPETGSYKKNDAGLPTRRTEEFRKVKAQYEAIAANNEYGMVLDPNLLGVPTEGIPSMLDAIIEMQDVRLVDMNMTQLETVYNVLRTMEHSIMKAGKTFTNMRWSDIHEMADSFMEDTETRKTKRAITERHYMLDIETPLTFFYHMGESGHAFYRMLRNAQDAEQVMQDELVRRVQKVVSQESRNKAEKEVVEFTTQRGEKLTLSKAHIMDIYLFNKRPQAQGHLLGGGIVQPKVGKVRKGTDAILLNEMDVADIIRKLTPEERKIADGLQEITQLLAEWGNEASMTVYGYKKFNDPNYWMIKSSSIGINQTVEQGQNKPRSIGNMGSAKNVIPEASNTLDILGVFNTFDQHAADMLCYSAWLAPMEDANRLFNYKYRDANWNPTGKTMKGIIDRVVGDGGTKYWLRLMEDIQNGLSTPVDTATEGIVMNAIGKTKRAAIAANLRVVIQQPTAFGRAAAVLDPDVMIAALGKDLAVKPAIDGWNKAVKYAPIAARKAAGGFEVASNPKQLAELMYKPESKIGKVKAGAKEVGLWLPGKADQATWGTIWNACELQVKKNNKSLRADSDAFNVAVKELFTEVIDQTQVVDGVLQRSQAMRSGSAFVKQMTSFTGEPTMGANMVIRAYDQARYETDPKKRGKAIKNLSRTVAAYGMTAVINAFAQSLIDALRDDDDDEEYWEKVWKHFAGISGDEKTWWDYARNVVLAGNVSNNLNPLTWLPVWKDVFSVIQGYSVERMDAASFGDFFDSIGNTLKSVSGDGKYTPGYAALRSLLLAGKILGNGGYNMLRDIEGAVRTFQVETEDYRAIYDTEKLLTQPENNKSRYMDILFDAYRNDDDAYEYILNDMLKGDYFKSEKKTTEEYIMDAMDDRLMKEQGVTKVSQLDSRFLLPKEQREYSSNVSALKNSPLWRRASKEQRKEVESDLYGIVTESKDSESMRDKIAAGKDYGLDESEYLLYQLALDMYDQPNDNGKYGTHTSEERANALLAADLGDEEAAYLWNTDESLEALAAGVDIDHYIEFKGRVSSLESGVDYKKGDSDSRKSAIRRILRDMGLSSSDYDYRWLWKTEYK